jgi:hypothetical protein
MDNKPLSESTVDGETIGKVVAKIEMATLDEPIDHVIMANLILAIGLQYPMITPEQLQQAMKDVSEYVCMVIDGINDDSQGRVILN